MRRTRQHRKKRKTRTRRLKRITRLKGGGVLGFSDIGDALKTIGYQLNNAVKVSVVNPSEVPPNVKGGDNPLPFKQPPHIVKPLHTV